MSTVQEALKAREERKKKAQQESEAKMNKVSSALESYKKRKQSNSQSAASDIAKRLNEEIETIKTVSTPSWGKGTLGSTLESTRESRVRLEKLANEIESYKSYLDAETYNSLSSTASKLRETYDSYLTSAEVMEKFDSEDSYTKWYEKYKNQEDEKNAVLNAEDFEEYSNTGAGVANPSWEAAHAPLDIGGWKPFGDGEKVNNMVTFAEAYADESKKSSSQGMAIGGTGSSYNEIVHLINTHMKDDEKAIYNYYVGKGDTKKAEEYLTNIIDVLRQREGGVLAGKVDNTALEVVFNLAAGTQTGFQGLGNSIDLVTGEEGSKSSTLQYASNQMRENNTGLRKVYNDLAFTTGNMTPSLIAGGVATAFAGPLAGKAVGSIVTGISSAGNSYAEMLAQDYGVDEARKYGVMVGAAEGGLSYLFSGISSIGGKLTGNAVAKVVDGIDNGIARFFADVAINMSSEALEEATQEVLDPVFKMIATGEDFEGIDWSNVAYSALLGGLSAGVLEGGKRGAQNVLRANKFASVAKEMYGGDVENLLIEAGTNKETGKAVDKYIDKYGKKGDLSKWNIAHLVQMTDAAKIKGASETKLNTLGEQGDVSKISGVLAKQATGRELTKSEQEILESSTYGQRMSNTLDPEKIKSGEYDTGWSENIGTRMINAGAYNKGKTLTNMPAGRGKTNVSTTDDDEKEVAEAKIKASEAVKYADGDNAKLVADIAADKVSRVDGFTNEAATAMVKGYDGSLSPTEYTMAFDDAFKMGASGVPSSKLTRVINSGVSERVAYTAYELGRQSAEKGESVLNSLSNNGIINTNKSEAKDESGESIHLRNGSKRDGGKNTQRQVSRVEGSTGQTESRGKTAQVADSEAARLVNEGREVKVADLGILGGSNEQTVRLIDKANETSSMKEARKRAEARGLKVTFFTGDNLVIKDKSGEWISARAYIKGEHVFVRADHSLYTSDQLMRHELGHDMIAKGEVDIKAVRERLEETVGKDNIDKVAELYTDAYEGSGMSAEAIWEECICDSFGDMNIFAGNEAIGTFLDQMLPEISAAANESKSPTQTRGSPNGKASRETGKRQSDERQAMENNRFSRLRKFHDNLPNLWFAYSYDYFYVYSNQSYTDYKIIKKIPINETNSQLITEIERRMNDDVNSDTRTVDGWIKSFRSRKRLNDRHNDNARRGVSAGTVNGVDGGTRRGETGGHSSEGNGNSRGKFSRELDTNSTEYKINTSMTMAEAKRMIETAYKVNGIAEYYEGEYENAEDWLKKAGSDEVEMYIENDYDLQAKYINSNEDILNEEYRISDVLEAYLAGTLIGKEKPKPKRLDVSQSTKLEDDRFYSPQKIEDAKATFELANQKAVGKDANAINRARAEILLFAHNKGAAELLGITQAELNKKLRSWSRYSATAKSISEKINAGVAEENRWTGIENSSYINKAKVTNEDIERLVSSVEGDSKGYERKYIARVMLAADTHIDYSGLKFKFASSQQVNADNNSGGRVLGFYDDTNRLIEVTHDKPHTVAHEMGHYIDAQWGRELVGGSSSHLFLTHGVNADIVRERYGEPGVQFLNNFKLFINSLSDVNQNYNSYYNDRKEIFARFFARFIEWTDNIATGNKYYSYESTMYNDEFTQAQYVEFVRLLQEKALLDGTRENQQHGKASRELDDEYSRIYSMKSEVNQLREDIRKIEASDDFKSQMAKLSEAVANDDVANGVKAYEEWKKVSGYGELVSKRDALLNDIGRLTEEYEKKRESREIEEEKAAIAKSGLSEADYFRKQAVKEFGYTPHFYDAGYILPNGKMLNFSGEKDRHFGSRGQDHRAIGIIYANTQGTDALIRFMNDGNIRIMAESPGLDISSNSEPTREQYSIIRSFIYEYANQEYFNIDLSDERGNVIGSLEYEGRINPTRVINDVKHYYETGEIREQSNVDRFRYSRELDTERVSYAPTFYSHMGKVIDDIKLEKMGTSSILNHLKNRGVKDEELKWSGIEVFLDGKKSVTKAELQEFVAGSQLQIEEEMPGETKWSQYKLEGGENYRELVFKMPDSNYSNRAMRGHWGQDAEGILVHARIQDFTVDGKKMLFIEELQSDWHNEGREKGYTTPEYEDAVAVYDKLANEYSKVRQAFNKYVRSSEFRSDPDEVSKKKFDWLRSKMDIAEKRMQDAERDVEALKKKGMGDVADAPFRDNYHEYVLKRLLRMAAEEGYDSIGWTIADTQSKRWSYDYEKAYQIEYDQEMPKFLRKYGKKWGTTVGKSSIDNTDIWSMDISDSMKESVLYEGQPKYSRELDLIDYINEQAGKESEANLTKAQKVAKVRSELEKMYVETSDVVSLADSYFDNYGGMMNKSEVRYDFLHAMKTMVEKSAEAFDKAYEEILGVAEELVYNPKNLGSVANDFMEMKNYIRGIKFKVQDRDKPEFGIYGGFGEFRKKHMGKLTLANNGISVDSVYMELQGLYGTTYFPEVNTVAEQLMVIADIVDTPLSSVAEVSYDLDAARDYTAQEIVEKFADMISESYNREQESKAKNNTEFKSNRNPHPYSNRSLLANALEAAAQNDIERNKLKEYKAKIDLINSEEQKLRNLREQIKELSFKKGPKDTEAIKSLQFEANQAANRINTYDRQLLNLESTKALKGVLEREKEQARKRAEQKGKEALKKYRERAAKAQRELMNRYQESRKRATEGRNKTAMRYKIKGIVSELNTLLLKPTAKKHIKEELRKEVADALLAINMDTVGADERVAMYNDLIAKEKDPDVIAELTKTRDNIQLQGDNLKEKLNNLQSAYEKIKNADDIELKLSYQEVIQNSIKAVSEKVGNTSIRNMTLEQLEMVYDLFSMIRKTIRDANKSFKEQKGQTVMQMAEAVNDQVRTVGGQPYKRNAIIASLQRVGWTFLKPFVAFRTIGSVTLTNMYKELRNGEDTFYGDVKAAQSFIEDQYKKHGYKSWNMKKNKTFTAKSGKTFDLTLEQMMTLYAYYQREQAHDHIIEGGIVFEDSIITEKNKLGVPIKYEVTTKDAFNLSEETFKGICDYLEQEHKDVVAFVKEMQAYLSDTMGAKGNEVSMELLGVKLFKEKFYLPIKSSQYYMNFKAEEAGEVKLKSPAFSKETVHHANNPIVIHNFTDLWAEHINDMSMYHSFVLALEDFTRVYNYKTKTDPKVETMDTKATLETAYPGVTKYINKFLKDMNGGVRSETVGWAEKLTSLSKKGAVLGSASVAIQQPSAVMRAMAYINPKYFVATTFKSMNLAKHRQDFEELKKYAPIAGIKEMGRFDVGMGQGTVDWIRSDKTVMDKAEDILSLPPAFMDEVTWISIWNAVKRETAHNNPTLKTSSEEFLKLAGERFTDVVSMSQVYDSVFSRSDLMRNKSWIAKSLTAFMAEPTTTLNMIWDSWVQAKRSGSVKGYAKAITTTGAPIVAATVLNAALKSIIMAMRDDDEDESYAEKYLEHFVGDLKDSLNPLTLIPFVKDIVSIFKGYDVERMDMALFSDIKKAIDAFDSDSKTSYEKWSGLIGAISAFFGVPVKNVERDVRGLINTVFGKTEETTSMGLLNALEEGWTGKEKSNGQQLYEAMVKGDKEHIERVEGRFEDEKSIETAIRKALRDNDPRIKEAAKARYDGDIAEYKRIAKEIIAEGKFKQDDVVAAINSEVNAIKNSETNEDETSEGKDEITSIYSTSDLNAAFDNGDTALAKEIIQELIDTKVANGMDEKKAKSSLRSSMTSYWKPLYKEASESERTRIRKILYNSGLYGTADDVVKTAQDWLKD